jgi:DNA transformation protein
LSNIGIGAFLHSDGQSRAYGPSAGRRAKNREAHMDNEAISDLFSGLGPIEIRRLFGGKGIYHNGIIVAIEIRGELMLKADAESAPEFVDAGCKQWTYTGSRHGKLVSMPYWTVPDGALDDAGEMTPWAKKAYEAGLRAGK